MADLIPTRSYIVALGPIKCEILEFSGTVTVSTGGTQTGFTSADTFKSKLVTPLMVFPIVNENGVSDGFTTTISNKTITMTNTGVSADHVLALVFGF